MNTNKIYANNEIKAKGIAIDNNIMNGSDKKRGCLFAKLLVVIGLKVL